MVVLAGFGDPEDDHDLRVEGVVAEVRLDLEDEPLLTPAQVIVTEEIGDAAVGIGRALGKRSPPVTLEGGDPNPDTRGRPSRGDVEDVGAQSHGVPRHRMLQAASCMALSLSPTTAAAGDR